VTVQRSCNGSAAAQELAVAAVRSGRAGTVLVAAGDRFGAPGLDHWRSHPSLAHGDGGMAAAVGLPAPGDEFHVLGLAHTAAPDLWRTRDTGKLRMPTREVPEYVPCVRRLMVGAYEERFGPEARSYYPQTGHLGSGDMLANLVDIRRDDLVPAGGLAPVLNAGGGYSCSAALVRRGPR